MKKKIRMPIIAGSLILLWLAVLPHAVKAETVFNVDRKGVAIKGYDTVGYFTMSEPVKGKKEFSAPYAGATWRFSTAVNRDMFLQEPGKYVPRYGGYCAYGVAEGGLFDIAPDAWTIYEEKLYLNQSKRVRELWLKDIPGHIKRADLLWPKIQKNR